MVVTGGAGYIGSHTCKSLLAAGFTPVTYDNLERGHASAVKWGPLVRGDIRDRQSLVDVLARYRPAAVLHFAAYAYVGESIANPELYYDNNVGGTLSVLEAMRATEVANIVFSSTCATYGLPSNVPIFEEEPQNPINPYGATKLAIERMLRDYRGAHGIKSVSLRYFNAAGADPDCETGEDHDPETHLIPIVLDAAAGRRAAVTVFGSDYGTPDGTCIRDYIHVTDLADAHVCSLRALLCGTASFAYNLGAGYGVSVLEVIAAARRITRAQIPVIIGPRRTGDPDRLFADNSRARDDLGWIPQYSTLDMIIQTAWAWDLHRYRSA